MPRVLTTRCCLCTTTATDCAGGHYTAHVRQPDARWLLYNDAAVSIVEERTVLRERPYLLFYERVAQQ
jgi:ubiquitin C-terminal hydrolase